MLNLCHTTALGREHLESRQDIICEVIIYAMCVEAVSAIRKLSCSIGLFLATAL